MVMTYQILSLNCKVERIILFLIKILFELFECGLARLNCCYVSSLSWLGKTFCPPDSLVKSDIKASFCTAIFRLGRVVLQYVRVGEVFCGSHDTHVCIICPDITYMRNVPGPSHFTVLQATRSWARAWERG